MFNVSRTLKNNLDISAPIMSRFDLFFVVLDECDEVADYNIAQHILLTRQGHDETQKGEYSREQLQRYIKFARQFNPEITPAAKEKLDSQLPTNPKHRYALLAQAAGGVPAENPGVLARMFGSKARAHPSNAAYNKECTDFSIP